MELKYQIEGDPQKAIQSLNRLIAKQEESIQKLRDTNRTARTTKSEFEGIGGALGRYISVGAAIGVVTAALHQQAQVAREAGQRIGGMADNLKRLAQVSESAEEFRALQALARSISGEVPEAQALEIVRQARTSGFTAAETRTLAGAALVEPDMARFIQAIDGVTDSFEGLRGGVEGTANVALRMLRERTFGSMAEVLDAARANADIIRDLGGTFEDAAAIATVAAGQRDPGQASTQIRQFLGKLVSDGRFRGGAGVLEDIAATGRLSDAELSRIFGEREKPAAVLARDLLTRNLPQIAALSREGAAAAVGPESLFAQAQRRALEDPRLREEIARRRSTEALRMAEEPIGLADIRRESVIAEIKRRRVGANTLEKFLDSAVLESLRIIGAEPETIARFGAGRSIQNRFRGKFGAREPSLDERLRIRDVEAADILRTAQSLPELSTNTAIVAENTRAVDEQNKLLRNLQGLRFINPLRPVLTAGIE